MYAVTIIFIIFLTVILAQAVGEPPFGLGITVLHAIKQAIYAARADYAKEQGLKTDAKYFRLDSPATAERIRVSCTDRFMDLVGNIHNHFIKV